MNFSCTCKIFTYAFATRIHYNYQFDFLLKVKLKYKLFVGLQSLLYLYIILYLTSWHKPMNVIKFTITDQYHSEVPIMVMITPRSCLSCKVCTAQFSSSLYRDEIVAYSAQEEDCSGLNVYTSCLQLPLLGDVIVY